MLPAPPARTPFFGQASVRLRRPQKPEHFRQRSSLTRGTGSGAWAQQCTRPRKPRRHLGRDRFCSRTSPPLEGMSTPRIYALAASLTPLRGRSLCTGITTRARFRQTRLGNGPAAAGQGAADAPGVTWLRRGRWGPERGRRARRSPRTHPGGLARGPARRWCTEPPARSAPPSASPSCRLPPGARPPLTPARQTGCRRSQRTPRRPPEVPACPAPGRRKSQRALRPPGSIKRSPCARARSPTPRPGQSKSHAPPRCCRCPRACRGLPRSGGSPEACLESGGP